jgi:CheY-like chemotaxis protein
MPTRFRILLVDDNPALLALIQHAAKNTFPEACFVQVLTVEQAKAYINELNTYGPKLVLLDIDLGLNQTGFDFLPFLRAHPQGRVLPVVLLTVDEQYDTVQQAYGRGITAFTTKPDSLQDWRVYFAGLRDYWFATVSTPAIRFTKGDHGN